MNDLSRLRRSPSFLAAALLFVATGAFAVVGELQGYVLGVTGDRVAVDLGVFQGLKAGDVGTLKRGGRKLATLEVVTVDRGNAFMRVVEGEQGLVPREGDIIFFAVSASMPKAGAGRGGEDGFVPLLVDEPAPKREAASRLSTQTHGRLRAWQFFQTVDPIGARYRLSRLDSDGAVDHIAGSLWSMVWSGNETYRDGNQTSSADDFRRGRFHAQRLTLSRPIAEKGFVRAGRFFANELPGLGTVDGAAVQVPVSGLKVGVVAGARPDRRDMHFSSRELMASVYASIEAGAMGRRSYAATLGALHTRWQGRADELAVLFDQRFDFGPLLGVYQTSQFDFNAGTAAVHKGTRLTRFDLSANSAVRPWLTFRGGLSHFETIDVAAERSLAGIDPALYIDNGFWRYWAGSSQNLPWGLGLDEEVSWTNVRARFQPGLWRATLSRQGLPWLASGRIYASAYNLTVLTGTDYGGSTGLTAPFFNGKFSLDSSLGLRYERGDQPRRRLKAGDASLRLDWRPSRSWSVDAAVTRVWQGSVRSSSVSSGVSYRW